MDPSSYILLLYGKNIDDLVWKWILMTLFRNEYWWPCLEINIDDLVPFLLRMETGRSIAHLWHEISHLLTFFLATEEEFSTLSTITNTREITKTKTITKAKTTPIRHEISHLLAYSLATEEEFSTLWFANHKDKANHKHKDNHKDKEHHKDNANHKDNENHKDNNKGKDNAFHKDKDNHNDNAYHKDNENHKDKDRETTSQIYLDFTSVK